MNAACMWRFNPEYWGAIHSTKIPTGPTGKIGLPQKVDQFFWHFSGWTEPIHFSPWAKWLFITTRGDKGYYIYQIKAYHV